MGIFTKKSLESIKEASSSSGLEKKLGAMNLIFMGLGAIIGTGVFVFTGTIAYEYSGPAVMVSYAIAGLVCTFVALAYAELSVMIPTSGGVYTYTYVSMGQLAAWFIGCIMFIELGLGAATVSAAWAGYITQIIENAGLHLPDSITKVPAEGGVVNLLAVFIAFFTGIITYLGTKDSQRLNTILVIIKVVVIGGFIIVAAPHFDSNNWTDFMPKGFDDVLVGASILFFAFNGFNVVASAAEECKNPKRDLTIGIIGSLFFSTLIYVIVAGVLTGITHYSNLNNVSPLAHALALNGSNIGSTIVAIGAVAGMTTVLMMQVYGLSRIAYVISRDNLLPQKLCTLHPKYNSPYKVIALLSLAIGLLGGFCPYTILGQLSSMGSLIDYIAVITIVMMMRFSHPNIERGFKCPALFIVAPLAWIGCVYLLFKQVIDKNWGLMLQGKLFIYIVIVTLLLYFIKPKDLEN